MATNFKELQKAGLAGYDYTYKRWYLYDVKTSNLSFIQTSKDLEYLGVKNNKFFLKLFDPSLIGVDPYSPTLSKEIITRIMVEVSRNPWYYLREIARIPSQGGAMGPGSGSPYLLNRANLAMNYCIFNNINNYTVAPRQTGKTQSAIAAINWIFKFGTSNSNMTFINHHQANANENLSRLKDQSSLLPLYLQQTLTFSEDGEAKRAKGTNNVTTLRNPLNSNSITTRGSANSISTAETVGRGLTTPVQWYDELEFTKYIGTIIAAAGPAFVRAADNAAKNRSPYCRIYTTTPGDQDSEPVESTDNLREYAAKFVDNLYDMTIEELHEYLSRNSKIDLFYIQYSYKQLGFGESYFRKMCQQLTYDKVKIKREVLLVRMRGSSDSPFDPEDLDAINSMQKDPIRNMVLSRVFNIELYEKVDPRIPYFIGIDMSTGTNNDNTAITIVNPYTEKPIGEFKSPVMGHVDAAKFVRMIIRRVCPRGILCIERNSLGDALIELLRKTDVAGNLYFDKDRQVSGNNDERLDEQGFVKREAINRKSYGIFTNVKNREIMMSILLRFVADKKANFVTHNIIDDLNNLIKMASGKIAARPGAHDDSIMSFLIALTIMYHGNNLRDWGYIRGSSGPDLNAKEEADSDELSYEAIYSSMPEDMKEYFGKPEEQKPELDYEDELMKALMDARNDEAQYNPKSEVEVSYTNTDDDSEIDDIVNDGDDPFGSDNDDFFNKMNS